MAKIGNRIKAALYGNTTCQPLYLLYIVCNNKMKEQGGEQAAFSAMIRVIRILSIRSRRQISDFSVQVQAVRNCQGYDVPLATHTTGIANKLAPLWMQDIYYNNCRTNYSFHFSLLCKGTVTFTPNVLEGRKLASYFIATGETGKQTFTLRFGDEGESQVVVEVQVSIFSNEDCLSGLQMPEASLSALKEQPQVPHYTAIDVMKVRQYNLFSCMDQPLQGFDRLQLFPTKFKVRNRQVRE